MANALSQDAQFQVRSVYLATRSLKATARATGFSRNTIRKLVKPELRLAQPPSKEVEATSTKPLNLPFLEKLIEGGRRQPESRVYIDAIEASGRQLATELGANTSVRDQIDLQLALVELMNYWRYTMRSFMAADQSYCGPFAKTHDKVARAARSWSEAAQTSLNNYLRLVREIDLRQTHGNGTLGRAATNVLVNQIHIGSARASSNESDLSDQLRNVGR